MLARLFHQNLKKKNFFFSLVLYFYFLTYKILIFLRIDVMHDINDIFYKIPLGRVDVLKCIKINTSNILSIFNGYNKKYAFNIFKRDLFLVSIKNPIILNYFDNPILLNLIIMISIDYYFINIKYLCKIAILHKLLLNNYNLYFIFFQKIYYIYINYIYNIISYKILNK